MDSGGSRACADVKIDGQTTTTEGEYGMHVFAIPERPRRICRNGMGIDKEGKMDNTVHQVINPGGGR
jgi:hypothetical protein